MMFTLDELNNIRLIRQRLKERDRRHRENKNRGVIGIRAERRKPNPSVTEDLRTLLKILDRLM